MRTLIPTRRSRFTGRPFLSVVFALAIVALVSVACGADDDENGDGGSGTAVQTAKNVILLVGDGMSNSHVTAARLYSVGRDGQLAMDTLPVSGFARTWSTDGVVTDSAAAATALATGVKTYDKAIGVDPDGAPVETILEKAQAAGKSAGLITNVLLSHATPASFAAHNPQRDDYLGITLDMFEHDVDVLLGGGEDYFLPAGTAGCFPGDGKRTDGRNLIEEAKAKGYATICDEAGLNSLDLSATEKLLGTFADENMARPFAPDLAAMTEKAIEVLDRNEEGFFLMVEGGQIDEASHANDALNTLGDIVDFDQAVAAALAFQAQHPNTLVIVVADHSTGGLTIEDLPLDGDCPDPSPASARECTTLAHEDGPFTEAGGASFWLDWSTLAHTAEDVGVKAIGPGADALGGVYENTLVFEAMRDALGLP